MLEDPTSSKSLIVDLPPTPRIKYGKAGFCRIIPLALFCLVLTGCSAGKEEEQKKATDKLTTEQTVEAVKDYGKKPLDKARAAQQLGDERTKAIDETAKGQ